MLRQAPELVVAIRLVDERNRSFSHGAPSKLADFRLEGSRIWRPTAWGGPRSAGVSSRVAPCAPREVQAGLEPYEQALQVLTLTCVPSASSSAALHSSFPLFLSSFAVRSRSDASLLLSSHIKIRALSSRRTRFSRFRPLRTLFNDAV